MSVQRVAVRNCWCFTGTPIEVALAANLFLKFNRRCMSKDYYRKNKKRLLEEAKEYRANNIEKITNYEKNRRKSQPEGYLWSAAKQRAKRKGLKFTIKVEDIVIPNKCPLLGIYLRVESGVHSYHSPTIDRKDSTKGYTKENIWIISYRANHLKNDGTFEELATLVKEWKKYQHLQTS